MVPLLCVTSDSWSWCSTLWWTWVMWLSRMPFWLFGLLWQHWLSSTRVCRSLLPGGWIARPLTALELALGPVPEIPTVRSKTSSRTYVSTITYCRRADAGDGQTSDVSANEPNKMIKTAKRHDHRCRFCLMMPFLMYRSYVVTLVSRRRETHQSHSYSSSFNRIMYDSCSIAKTILSYYT